MFKIDYIFLSTFLTKITEVFFVTYSYIKRLFKILYEQKFDEQLRDNILFSTER